MKTAASSIVIWCSIAILLMVFQPEGHPLTSTDFGIGLSVLCTALWQIAREILKAMRR